MIDKFLRFFDHNCTFFDSDTHMDIYYSRRGNWCIHIWRDGYVYYDGDEQEIKTEIINVKDCDMESCFAKAYVALKEWLTKHDCLRY